MDRQSKSSSKTSATTTTNNRLPATRDIVNQFMKLSLEERGHGDDWTTTIHTENFLEASRSKTKNRDAATNSGNDHDQQEELTEICRVLYVLTSEMQDFIRRTQGDRIQAMFNELLEDFHYNSFRTIADELFIEKIAWYRIVTLLAYSSECAYRAIETRDNNRGREMVSQITDWMCKYIDENLAQWISQQEGGWVSLVYSDAARTNQSLTTTNGTARSLPQIPSPRSLRHYLGVAAVSVLTLYLCSKFAISK